MLPDADPHRNHNDPDVVPAAEAQAVCDILVSSGVLAIWNFAPVHLNVPDNVLVRNEDIAGSLAVLAKRLAERL